MTSFDVEGLPVAKGSLKAFVPKGWNRPVLTSTAKGLKPWAALVRAAAIVAKVHKLETGPVCVGLLFRLPRPDVLRRRKTLTEQPPHVTRPDVDKLTRAVLDALTGVAWADDGQVDDLRAKKRYCEFQEEPGVKVFIKRTETT